MKPVTLFSACSTLAGAAITCVHRLTKQLKAIHDRLFGEKVHTGAAFDVNLACRWLHAGDDGQGHALYVRHNLT
ncbi:hypothetical protein [Sphingomonas abaci]|uniref:Uncharacterized protein n=1 Tax=Sphingomonas abaci TaxID=237611 RepID=A0A7W7AMF5_9SPHN|nr:hypothetical protein [Sphingomonas abaci]MBB4619762.1 hypothetical protein [Sphingomonas abaci]